MDSLENDVVCGEGGLTHYEDAIELALARVRDGQL